MKLNNKFAIGCLIQWYEIEMIEDYVQSLRKSVDTIENKENVIVDFKLVVNQDLEKIDETKMTIDDIITKFEKIIEGFELDVTEELVTIADYRRWFNDYYCEKVDVLMWGESDSLIPVETFQILDGIHSQVKNQTPKYLVFFGGCKMWDESWKPIEHTDFTDKPFIEGDDKNWWSLRYTMNQKEMENINEKVNDLDIRKVSPHKFNGCGLVISSEVIKSGVNIPRSVFFIHEDTAFMMMTNKVLGEIPQYVVKNILLVHNRKHPKKRMYIQGESADGNEYYPRKGTDWYTSGNKMCEHNAYNIFNQSKSFTWEDVFND